MDKAYRIANDAKPSLRQIKWQETEFYALISYGLPVFNGKQYGDGCTPPAVFWPEDMNTDSWCDSAKKAGMKGILFTCKHYDGFCLWQTAMTDYSVKSSTWQNGAGDLVKSLSDSCRKYGLKFGVYLTLWDRHEKTYGSGKPYDDYICGLLTELLTNYGSIFEVYLDSVISENEKRIQSYDFKRYFSLIREKAPDAVISFSGPDIRWCGNERGITRKDEWSPLPAFMGINEDGTSESAPKKHKNVYSDLDIGSRKAIRDTDKFIWYPCEVTIPMRPQWFFDGDDNYAVKTKDKLIKLYNNTVGNNSCLMLGLSPNKRGVLEDTDTQILTAFGVDLQTRFGASLLRNGAEISASSNNEEIFKITSETTTEYWCPEAEDKKPEIVISLGDDNVFDVISLSENIANGQRIEGFTIEILNEKNKWKCVYEGGTVGYKRICQLEPTKAKKIRIRFTEFRDSFEICHLLIN